MAMQKITNLEVQQWLADLQALATNKTCKSPEFLRPFHFVTLALVLKAQQALQLSLPDHLVNYATRMKLWEAVGIRPIRNKLNELDAVGRFLPIERLSSRDAVNEVAARLANLTLKAKMDDLSHRALDIAISELVDNCFAHSGASDGLYGVACAQYWPRGDLMQIAIADMGVGIRKSLESAETPDVRAQVKTANACELATEYGVTSKPSNHAGYGLALARELLKRNEGVLIVCSNQEWIRVDGQSRQTGRSGVNWDGTLVICEFNTNRQVRAADVYSQWPQVRGYQDDDFDF